ncbi:DUF3833 family protein [Rhodocyclus tenuis]|uniref:DUF3833 family protein n=2 Tax=Rhodocyclus TaxID=1064 RepID=A0A6L5K0S1_RHOTE|nr:DUF3833 domain-containing protein [Rhodocyclus gracilis]MQY52722.1 DUF3833 family protein [Rhodocyclus gracilis]MRD74106.1 DUF3833 family protein [Rhodocyclus gracilis]NJA90190.1 DUF3833 family protein [Rhodocyclus gracilis]
MRSLRRTIAACVLLPALALGVAGLSGCAGTPVETYRTQQPTLDLARYFNGVIDGWGMFQDRSGEVKKRFHVVINAAWEKRDGLDVGTLDEHFEWSDGTTSQRVWTITRGADGRYTGRADDVVGAADGEAAGNALRWRYVLALPVDGSVWNVDFDDWMYLMDDSVMINRSEMRKFGLRLGEVTLSFRKR